MIFGIGTDIVRVARMQKNIERYGEKFAERILTPAELEEYDLRNSNTGRAMRRELAAFNPTEEEFRAIYKLRQPVDEKYNNNDGVPSQTPLFVPP